MKRYYITLTLLLLITITGGQHTFAQDAPAVELQVETEQPLTEATLHEQEVTLKLIGQTWIESERNIENALTILGIEGVSFRKGYTESYTEFVPNNPGCVGFCWGRDVTRTRRIERVHRGDDNTVTITLDFEGDFDTDATLTFTVEAEVIENYDGPALTAEVPVTFYKGVFASATPSLTEVTLDEGVVTLTLSFSAYEADVATIINAVTVAGINGVTIDTATVKRLSDTEVTVGLNFDDTDFDTDTPLVFNIGNEAVADYAGDTFTAEIVVTAIIEVVSASVVSPLTEAVLDGSIVTLLLTGAAFEQDISKIRDAVLVSGIKGVTIDTATVQRLTDRKITVELDYDGTDFIRDTALTFTLTSKAIANHNGELTTEIPVTANSNEDVLTIFWTDEKWSDSNIRRANLDMANLEVSNVEVLVPGLDEPHIALDVVGGKMYWTDFRHTGGKIQRANFDGSDVENLVPGLDEPQGIALDVEAGKMYWTDETDIGKIQRANLDGSNIEDLVTRLGVPKSIALDVEAGKMYWTNWNRIQCANLDGSNVEDLVTGLDEPQGIALDVEAGKMYWTGGDGYRIRRANLDGSNVEGLVTSVVNPQGIALDVEAGKMYWADRYTEKIQRANFDGSNVEDLVTGLERPSGIAVAMSSLVNPTTKPTIVKEDVNRDGVVDVQDLAYVGLQYGKTGTNAADVNGDKVVDVDDFILVAAAVDAAAAAAPAARAQVHSHFTKAQLQGWLTEARASGNTSRTYQRGIAVVEQLLTLIAPEKTALLANYPNPFNPETWIPYQLSKSADVTLTIYAVDGHVVRQLALGHQAAGMYQSRSRAAYWDGRNAVGEPVASGVYFYTLTAGDFSATRKMLIRK